MRIKPFIERHPLASYFSLAFGISWIGVISIGWYHGYQIQKSAWDQILAWYFAMLAGPSLASILLTAFLEGRKGLKDLLARMLHWQTGLGWWVLSAISNPALVVGSLFALALLASPAYRPVFNPALMIFGLGAGFFEEIGWTGFVTPRIIRKPKWLPFAIGLGILHGLWHLLADFLASSATFGIYWLPYFLVFWIGAVAAYRVLMVWVYKHSGSLMLGILMHTVFTGSFIVFTPTLTAAEQLLWGVVYSASLWIIVGTLALANHPIAFLKRIPERLMVLMIRTAHGLITLYFLVCIISVYYAGITNQVNGWVYLAVGSLVVEALVVALNHGDCPLVVVHRKFGDHKAFFELFLPRPLAKQAVPVLGMIAAVGILLLIV